MPKTISQTGPRARHLAPVVAAGEDAARTMTELTHSIVQLAAAKPALRPLARLDVEQARKFLIDLDTAAASASPLLAMFLLGRCAEHAQALLDVLDAAVTP